MNASPHAILTCEPLLFQTLQAAATRHGFALAAADHGQASLPQLRQDGAWLEASHGDSDRSWPMPLRLGEVLDWVAAQARQSLPIELGEADGPRLQLQVLPRRIVRDGLPLLSLTEKDVAIIVALASAAKPVPREQLLRDVWGYSPEADTHTLETNIYRLRQKLDAAGIGNLLLTGEGGYYLART